MTDFREKIDILQDLHETLDELLDNKRLWESAVTPDHSSEIIRLVATIYKQISYIEKNYAEHLRPPDKKYLFDLREQIEFFEATFYALIKMNLPREVIRFQLT